MGFFEIASDVLISLIPPALVGVLFWVMMRSILRADQKERDTYREIEAEERAKRSNALGEQP
jgi:preprotein translocase subunit YajC